MVSSDKDQEKKKITKIKTFSVPFAIEEIKENITINTPYQASKEQIINKAINFHSQGKIQEAAKYYKFFINQGFNDYRVFSNYGIILKEIGKLKDAEFLYRKAIEINPNYAEAYYNLGIILKESGQLQDAEFSTRKAIEINPNYAEAYYNLGIILKESNQLQDAEFSTRKAIEIKPDFTFAYYNLGNILRDLGNLKDAEFSYRKSIEIKPDYAEAYYNLGIILKELDKSKDAEFSTRKAIEIKPDYAEAYYSLGSILRNLGNLKEAEISLRKAIEINPNFARAYFILSLFIIPKSNDNLVKFLFSKEILESKENIAKLSQADIYFARGNILERKQDYKESYKMFRKANLITRREFKSNFTTYRKALEIDNLSTKEIEEVSEIELAEKDLPSPIFTIGLPRAGKSTIESILSNNNLLKKFGDRKGISEVIRDYKNIEISFNSLGISTNSTYKDIRTAYLKLAKQYHPDKGGNKELMAKIAEGYNFLRSEYEKKQKDYTRPNLYKFFLNKLGEDLSSINFTCHTSPNNILYTGVIASQIPKSKIIYCYRNPKDHIIELYKYNLKNYLTLKTSVIELAKIIVMINNLMEEYKIRFNSKIYFLNFDQLILEPKREIESLLNWLNWKYDENYLTPKLIPKGIIESKNDFNSFNASYINKSKNYAEILKPVEEILSKLIISKND